MLPLVACSDAMCMWHCLCKSHLADALLTCHLHCTLPVAQSRTLHLWHVLLALVVALVPHHPGLQVHTALRVSPVVQAAWLCTG